ncbi:MAG TPA: hypothetical protein VL285_24575 [Bryobacteraceae bacterium]|nr:hypothetical protein [Bryobacteraceae bacterium]
MTGRIKALSFESTSGLIESENGSRFSFESSAVLAYDAAHLTVGQLVTFITEGLSAFNISVHRAARPQVDGGTRKGGVFRYVGFNQANSIRTFRFERTFTGELAEMFTVSTDLALLAKYRISLQEGPALCSRLLTLEIDEASAPVFERSLTETDILQDMASRPGPGARNHKRVAHAV